MKHIIISLILLLSGLTAAAQANGAQTNGLFQLPMIPDSISNFNSRCNYFVAHYWDFADLKKCFSSRDKMTDAFDQYLALMPYADADVVYASVDKFMQNVSKRPTDVEFIANLAESRMYADTAAFQSDQLYLRFLDNILKTKKLTKPLQSRYELQSSQLHNSQEGMVAPEFSYTRLDGSKGSYRPDTTQFATIIMLIKPGDSNSDMARLRLDADYKTAQLVKSGRVKIYCIAPGDEKGRITAADGWETGYSTQAAELYDTRRLPMFFIINSDGKILKKGSDVEPILNIMQLLRAPRAKKQAATAEELPAQPES